MNLVAATPLAVLTELHTVRIVLLVLLGRVIATLAFGASKCDQSSHEFSFALYLQATVIHMNHSKVGPVRDRPPT